MLQSMTDSVTNGRDIGVLPVHTRRGKHQAGYHREHRAAAHRAEAQIHGATTAPKTGTATHTRNDAGYG